MVEGLAINSFRTLDEKEFELENRMLTNKTKILIFTDWYLPGYKAGGPIKSVANFVNNFKEEFDIYIFTSNTDLNEPNTYKGIESNTWLKKDGFQIFYASSDFLTYKNIKSIVKHQSFNFFYLNSLLSPKYAIFPLMIFKRLKLQKKVVLAPRGMLGEAALKIKGKKKKAFLTISKSLGLYKNITWQASSELEKKEIQKNINRSAEIKVALNLFSGFKDDIIHKEKTFSSLKLFFFSRINEKKNLDFALKVLSDINDLKIIFDIFGPIEDAVYWGKCQQIIKLLPQNIEVKYRGAITFNQIEEKLSPYHFMFLPTKNENFGHVIAESMSIGCPVIISDETPWRNLEKIKAGFDIPLAQKEVFIEKIKFAYQMNQNEYNIWAKNAYEHAKEKLENETVIAQNRALFQ